MELNERLNEIINQNEKTIEWYEEAFNRKDDLCNWYEGKAVELSEENDLLKDKVKKLQLDIVNLTTEINGILDV